MDPVQLQGFKVVTPIEMVRMESLAISHGETNEDFMIRAGKAISEEVAEYILSHSLKRELILLAGKGNNGGDGFVAATFLLQEGFSVTAYHLFPKEESSPLCRTYCESFQQIGGDVLYPKSIEEVAFPKDILILDGLFGTGFQGALEELPLAVVKKVNQSSHLVFSIDIPSGLNGTTGEVKSDAIRATKTLFLGLPKTGFFLKAGWNYVGSLIPIDFGIQERYLSQATEVFFLANTDLFPSLLPPLLRTRHKYQAGLVLGLCGSPGMTGAAHLSGQAALRSGAGLVRLFTSPAAKAELSLSDECIVSDWEDPQFLPLQSQAKAFFLGPGLGRSKEIDTLLSSLIPQIHIPLVIDADGLFFLAHHPDLTLPPETVLTPHRREMERLLRKENLNEQELFSACHQYSDQKGVIIVLKGAPTFLFRPHSPMIAIPKGDPGMATAGTGDVLTGMIASFLAQGLSPYFGAALAIYLHGLAGELAAEEKTSYSLIASDLIQFLPKAFKVLLKEPS